MRRGECQVSSDKKGMRRKIAGMALSAMLFALCLPAEAQQKGKVPRIGILFIGGRNQPHLEAFKQGLWERGYTEGKNIDFEYRYAEGREDRLPELAAELVQLKVDVIVVTADVSAEPAQQATKTTYRRDNRRPGYVGTRAQLR